MLKTIKQVLTTMRHWLSEVSKHNDKTIKITDNLKLALLNLKVEQAHLGEAGRTIQPIADLIETAIVELHDSTKNMVTNGRKELRESFNEIEKYINNKEGENNE